MELKQYILPLKRWWWLLVAATMIAAVSSLPGNIAPATDLSNLDDLDDWTGDHRSKSHGN